MIISHFAIDQVNPATPLAPSTAATTASIMNNIASSNNITSQIPDVFSYNVGYRHINSITSRDRCCQNMANDRSFFSTFLTLGAFIDLFPLTDQW